MWLPVKWLWVLGGAGENFLNKPEVAVCAQMFLPALERM